jgi:predicted membrane chloride channel (bestrophin family)
MSLLTSTVFRRVAKPILSLTCLAALICGYNLLLVPALATAVPRLGVSWMVAPSVVSLNITPFSLVSPMIGLLLVFRTNFSYARFLEGRLLWGSAVRHCRDAARLVATYLPPSVARTALFGHLQAWTWLLKAHLRAGRLRTDPNDPTAYKDDPSRDVRACLPPEQSEPLLGATNRPYVSMLTLTALLRHLRGGLPDYATRRLEEIFVEMGAVTGGCERLLSTPMPLSYTRFTGRSLMVWLGTLPLALWPLMGWATVPAMFVLSYVVLGIDEIGVEIEEPFAILPLQALCEAVRRDVGIAEAQSAVLLQAWPGGLGYDKEPTSASLVSALAAMQDGVDYGRPPPPLK